LPHEFAHFGISMDESRARFDEGVEQVRLLLEGENVTSHGRFHSFANVTSLPRPTQLPRPPFWVAALATPESFERAGRNGYAVMAIPLAGGRMAELIRLYRDAWTEAGHSGRGRVMMAFHMFCHRDHQRALDMARQPLNRYLKRLVDGARHWLRGADSVDYPGYDKIIAALDQETMETQIDKGAAWVGDPAAIRDAIAAYVDLVGDFEIASLQVNFNTIAVDDAERSMRLFAEAVMPQITV
jgi:alkanesulfonate monooxygenase SsuD/methylene tetrahydromethanopterin reductase-like flavin-dependent oxidoreductase (luciferase family)